MEKGFASSTLIMVAASCRNVERYILWWLLVLQIICQILLLQSMPLAIISMIDTNNDANKSHEEYVLCPNTSFFLRNMFTSQLHSETKHQQEKFNWSQAEQNMVLSGSSWLIFISVLPGSILAHKYGSKRAVGYSQFISSIMSSLIPMLAHQGAVVVSWVRAIQIFITVIAFPGGVYSIIGNWSPPTERVIFESTYLVGNSLGSPIVSFCFGYVAEYINWKIIFHLTSVCGVIWTLLWFTLVYDTPRQHPTISSREREFIETSLKDSIDKNEMPIPWKNILTCIPVYICTLASGARLWLMMMPMTYFPVYSLKFYGLNANEVGTVFSILEFSSGVAAFGIGYLSDVAIKKNLISITHSRKLCAFVGTIIASIPLIVIAFVKCNINVVLVCMTIYSILQVYSLYGSTIAFVDMSPKFCGILVGISVTFSFAQNFVIGWAVNYFSVIWESEKLWKNVFLFTAIYAIVANIAFLIFGTSRVQKWNFADTDNNTEENKRNNVNVAESHSLFAK